ncbi:MAG: hypothetical protein QM820_47285 [Minicystis sp.]
MTPASASATPPKNMARGAMGTRAAKGLPKAMPERVMRRSLAMGPSATSSDEGGAPEALALMGAMRSITARIEGSAQYVEVQQRTMPTLPIIPKSRKPRNSVIISEPYEAAAAQPAVSVGSQVSRWAMRTPSWRPAPRRRASRKRDM